MRKLLLIPLAIVCYGCASDQVYESRVAAPIATQQGELRVEIRTPTNGQRLPSGSTSVEVDGGASNIGGVRYLDMIFVMDGSDSLRRSDPENHRAAGAIELVRSLSPKSDIQMGVVSFNRSGRLLQALSADREAVAKALDGLPRDGQTDVASGIRTALAEFQLNARDDSSRVIMLFTDGRSSERRARQAMAEAAAQGVAIHTLLLGSSSSGAAILEEIAMATGASFQQVLDPAQLTQAFLNMRTTGVDTVHLQVNEGNSVPAQLLGGSFSGQVNLQPGENRIVAVARSLSGNTAQAAVTVDSGPPNCGVLDVKAERNGYPTLSLNQRAVEIVVDASRSMWGQLEGQAKMSIAQDTLLEATSWFPDDLQLGIRAYGHTSNSDLNDCADSELLVAFGANNRDQVRRAISNLRPLGQTPLAYALNQAAQDFGNVVGERAVLLVTDGIESCGGEPVAAAQALRDMGIKVNVIGFGMGNSLDEDTASLDALAQASGGRFLLASSTAELQDALAGTVGAPFQIFQGRTQVASGALGSGEPILLPEGDYRLVLNGTPAESFDIHMTEGEGMSLTLSKSNGVVSQWEERRQIGYTACPVPDAGLRASR